MAQIIWQLFLQGRSVINKGRATSYSDSIWRPIKSLYHGWIFLKYSWNKVDSYIYHIKNNIVYDNETVNVVSSEEQWAEAYNIEKEQIIGFTATAIVMKIPPLR